MRTLTGKCLCGAVVYQVDDDFAYALNCHCSQCRRSTGSAFKPLAGIARNRLRIIQGTDHLLIHGDPSGDPNQGHDTHCKTCGSLLFSVVQENKFVHVTLGTLVDTPSIRPQAHIFVGSKAPWFEITDDLPQFLEFPTG